MACHSNPLILLVESVGQGSRSGPVGIVHLHFIISRDTTGKTQAVESWDDLEQGLATMAYRPNSIYHLFV